ncbi:MAG: hypothetical protein WA418_25145 [Bradyrhizobium sp.]
MGEPHLPDKVVAILVSSDYARLVGRTMSERLDYIVDIASLHTQDELLRRLDLGRVLVRQVEKWLGVHGRRLRRPNESIDVVMCGLEFRKRRIRRSRPGSKRRRPNRKLGPKEPG